MSLLTPNHPLSLSKTNILFCFFQQRPVEWLLWCPSTSTGLVIIPEELELLIPDIRVSRYTRLVAYAAPVARSMLAFSSLSYFSFPPLPSADPDNIPYWLPIELGILAGRLYMTYDEALDMEQYLGQAAEVEKDDDDDGYDRYGGAANTASADGDVVMRDIFYHDKRRQPPSPILNYDERELHLMSPNPTSFLLEWLALRRTAQDVLHTPAAYVCQGRKIRPDHPFFMQPGAVARRVEEVEEIEDDEEGGGVKLPNIGPKALQLAPIALMDENVKRDSQDGKAGPVLMNSPLPMHLKRKRDENAGPGESDGGKSGPVPTTSPLPMHLKRKRDGNEDSDEVQIRSKE